MNQFRHCIALFLISTLSICAFSQEKAATKANPKETRDVDPLALDVLKAVTQPIEQAQVFSFKALVSEEQLATNGQIVTFFHTVDVTVQRPDKVHETFKGRGERVEFYQTKGAITMYAPDAKLYATVPAKDTIDENLADLKGKGVDIPVGPFVSSHLYDMATKGLITAYVIGRVKIYDKDVHQLAFSAPDADWQLWVTGGDTPRIVRAELVSKRLEGKPRTIVQFLDWNLSPGLSTDEFTFAKPADAQRIDILPSSGGK